MKVYQWICRRNIEMVNLTNVQGALLDSIIRQTKELMDAIEENRIYDAGRLYSQRNHNMELLSTIKTSDLSKLNNYSAFMNCLHNFNAKFASI